MRMYEFDDSCRDSSQSLLCELQTSDDVNQRSLVVEVRVVASRNHTVKRWLEVTIMNGIFICLIFIIFEEYSCTAYCTLG